jgi:cyclophilin family peptidyl-prolyl cis-trans isomerase
VLDPRKDYIAVVATTAGEITIDLDVAGAYETSNSFAFLGQMGFYDGMPFEPKGPRWHTATRAATDRHGRLCPEGGAHGVANKKGTVGMLRLLSDPGVVGSQWYLNLEDNSQFDTARIRGNPRPVFGTIINGLEVAAKLTEKDTVERITIEEK